MPVRRTSATSPRTSPEPRLALLGLLADLLEHVSELGLGAVHARADAHGRGADAHTRSEAPGWLADSDQLLVDELVCAVLAELAPPAGPLDAAEWQLGAVGTNDVDVDHAGVNVVGNAVGLLGIGREQVGAEPERGVVCQVDRLLFRPDAVDDRDRPE